MSDLIDIAATELDEEEERFRIDTIKNLLKKQETFSAKLQAVLQEIDELGANILAVADEKVSVEEIRNLKHVKVLEWAPINNWAQNHLATIEGLR